MITIPSFSRTRTILLFSLLLAGLLFNSAPANAPRIMPGQTAKQRVTALTTNVHWFDSLDDAKAAAKRSHKLIFWVHMLGSLTGDS